MPAGVILASSGVPWPAQTFPAAASAGGLNRVYLLTARDGPAAAFYARNGYDTSPRMALLTHRLRDGPRG